MSITAMITERLPDAGSILYHYGKNEDITGNETIVRVWPKGRDPWFGVFPQGYDDVEVTGLHVWPSTRKLFVIAGGSGYVVDIGNPHNWSAAHLSPITSFDSEAVDGLFVISDNLRVAAYSADQLLWKSDQISWNGIKNLKVTGDGIIGEAWDDLWGAWVSFLVDPQTGKHEGGATFSFEHA